MVFLYCRHSEIMTTGQESTAVKGRTSTLKACFKRHSAVAAMMRWTQQRANKPSECSNEHQLTSETHLRRRRTTKQSISNSLQQHRLNCRSHLRRRTSSSLDQPPPKKHKPPEPGEGVGIVKPNYTVTRPKVWIGRCLKVDEDEIVVTHTSYALQKQKFICACHPYCSCVVATFVCSIITLLYCIIHICNILQL